MVIIIIVIFESSLGLNVLNFCLLEPCLCFIKGKNRLRSLLFRCCCFGCWYNFDSRFKLVLVFVRCIQIRPLYFLCAYFNFCLNFDFFKYYFNFNCFDSHHQSLLVSINFEFMITQPYHLRVSCFQSKTCLNRAHHKVFRNFSLIFRDNP